MAGGRRSRSPGAGHRCRPEGGAAHHRSRDSRRGRRGPGAAPDIPGYRVTGQDAVPFLDPVHLMITTYTADAG